MKTVLSVVPDLFFATRIATVAEAAHARVVAAETGEALRLARSERPDLVLLDLHAEGDPMALARALKADEATRAIPIVGFHSHVNRQVREAALAAGVDHVMPRSAFTLRLPELLTGHRPLPSDG